MIKPLIIAVCILGCNELTSQNSLDSLLQTISSRLDIHTIDPDPYQRILFSEKSDTLFISRTVTKQPNKDTTLNIIYEIPLSNIKAVSTRTFCGGPGTRYYIDFFSKDIDRSFKEHLLNQQQSFKVSRVTVGTAQLKDSIHYQELCGIIKPYLKEYVPDCSLRDTSYWEFYRKDMQTGYFDGRLVEKAKLNGQANKAEVTSELIMTLLKDKSKESRFAGFELRLFIGKSDDLTKMGTSYTVFTPEEFNQVFEMLKSQKWEAGLCNNDKVDTLVSLQMSFN